MSDTKNLHDWSKDWEALQRQYWNAWTDLTRNQAGATPDASTSWHEGLEQWSRMFGSGGKQSEAAERLMSSAKSYLSLMQSMLSFAAGKDAAAMSVPSWLDVMRGGMNLPGFDPMQFGVPGFDPAKFAGMAGFDPTKFAGMAGFDPMKFAGMAGFDPNMFANMPGFDASALMNNPMAKALREISGQGVKGFEQLAAGALPMLQQFKQEGMSWLQVPAFGYAREHQEHYQKMLVAFAEFQEALKQYNALIMKSSQRSFEILELKIAERSEPGRQIDSMRALYDLWVDAAEEAYAEIALSEDFRKVYGDVVNSQMRVRSQLQQQVERIGVDLGMPTRTELNSVHKRLHDLRRELRDSQENQRNDGADGRDAEIAAMRAEIDDLRRLLQNLDPGAARKTAAPAAAKASPLAKRSRAKRSRAPRKRAAAKRAHVAVKSTAVVVAPAPVTKPAATRQVAAAKVPAAKPAAPKPVAVGPSAAQPARPKPASTKPSTGAKRRKKAARRAAARTPSSRSTASARSRESTTSPASFGDAIAAMRRESTGKKGGKKSRAARLSIPTRTSSRAVRRRSKP